MNKHQPKGKVYLVGAGPGHPDLITLRGKDCIQRADVIIYDYLASPALLKHASEKAELIYVGKKEGHHTLPQPEINDLIISKARQGLTVVRLKGGDPFIFGRGGEEAEALVKENIPFEVVPGVTSAIAAPAYAGIPLTHRDFTSTLAFVTGHEKTAKRKSNINWKALAKGIGTIVFFMGVKNLPNITQKLMAHGMPADTPVGLIRWGTTPQQMTVTGTLATIVERVKAAGLKAPAITVVGRVVQLRETLKWVETRPLLGKKIVVTRAREQASDLVKELSELGADCLEYPTIKVAAPDDRALLDSAIENLSAYDWLVFTSVNAVDFFFKRLFEKNKDVRALGRLQTATIGPATEGRLFSFGIKSDIVPQDYRAESVVAAFAAIDVKNKKMLLPRAKEARPVLPAELEKMGAVVDDIPVYCTLAVSDNAERLIQLLEDKEVDLITFTSSSTAKNFKSLLPQEKFKSLLKDVAVASIGPITSETAQKLGFKVHITAEDYTIPGLCQAIQEYFT
ncbi:MAG: uroporphyrinogen-III C-methyltransferase [Desulfobacterales bacterium]|nr:uroporphyrinogen-III C-methyltransferase [Desulfobacterales bacterium]